MSRIEESLKKSARGADGPSTNAMGDPNSNNRVPGEPGYARFLPEGLTYNTWLRGQPLEDLDPRGLTTAGYNEVTDRVITKWEEDMPIPEKQKDLGCLLGLLALVFSRKRSK